MTDSFERVLSYAFSLPTGGGQVGATFTTVDPAGNQILTSIANQSMSVSYPVVAGGAAQVKTYLVNEAAYLAGLAIPNALTGVIDENGSRYATIAYDNTGRVAYTKHAGGDGLVTFSYGADGSTSVVGALGDTRTYQFSTVAGERRVTSITGARCDVCFDGEQKSRAYDSFGNLASFTDWNGNVACLFYDPLRGLEVARLEGLSSGASCPTSVIGYVPIGIQRITQSQWHPTWRILTGEAAPLKLTYRVYNGQPDPTNAGVPLTCAPSAALLPDGNPIAVLCKKVEQATTDATGAAGFGAIATGSPRVWTYSYNSLGQMLTETGPRGNLGTADPNYAADTTTYAYYASTVAGSYTMGDLASVTNAAGQVTQFPLYDANGRVLKTVDPNGTTTSYSYHPRGWLLTKTVTPPSGVGVQTTTYGYDLAGQLTSVTGPDGSQIAFFYNPAHRLTGVTDSAGDSITYTLDAMGNRLTEQIKDPTGVLVRNITRVFDQLSQLQQVTGALQ